MWRDWYGDIYEHDAPLEGREARAVTGGGGEMDEERGKNREEGKIQEHNL